MSDPGPTIDPRTVAQNAWRAEFDKLRARFPKVQDTVLLCIHALLQDGDVRLDDLKAVAALHGLHVTGASLQAARRALGLLPPAPRRTSPEPPDRSDRSDRWEVVRDALAAEFPAAREGIRYALHRLRQDPSVTLKDIRDDAVAAGVKIGGRSMHSARALLNGGTPRPAAASSRRPRNELPEARLRELVGEIQASARGEVDRLRAAIAAAVRVLQDAL